MKNHHNPFRIYNILRNNAVMWDGLDYDQLVFTNRIFKKYGADYFYNRYYFLTNKYYEQYDNREKLDNVPKMVNLEKHNQDLFVKQTTDINNHFVPMMKVPANEYPIWQHLAQNQYYDDYANRKQLLDKFICSLPTQEEQLKAIKTMCLSNLSKNYLAFLDLDEDQMNQEQKQLFNQLLNFYNDIYLKEQQAKELMQAKAQKIKDEIQNASTNKQDKKVDFLSNTSSVNQELPKDEELLKNINNIYNNLNNQIINEPLTNDEQKTNDENQSSINTNEQASQMTSNNDLLDNNIDWNNENINNLNKPNIPVNQNQDLIINSENVKQKIDEISKVINNDLNKINIKLDNEFINQKQLNSLKENNTFNQIVVNQFDNNKNIINKDFTYNQYINLPIVYNIQALIDARNFENQNNKEIVNQMIESTIYYNNQYAHANIQFKPLNTFNQVTNTSNQNQQEQQKTESFNSNNKNNPFFSNKQTNTSYDDQQSEKPISLNLNQIKVKKQQTFNKPNTLNVNQNKINSFSSLNNKNLNNKALNLNLYEEEKFNFTNKTTPIVKQEQKLPDNKVVQKPAYISKNRFINKVAAQQKNNHTQDNIVQNNKIPLMKIR